MRRLFCLFLTTFLTLSAVAQRAPMKFGDIPEEHLLMTDYPADTNATAVVLGDFGETIFNDNFAQTFTYHQRVKLLRESAYETFGTVQIRYSGGAGGARIRSLRAQTIVPGSNGKPVVHRVDRGSIFKEKLEGDLEQISFTFPALQPGAIVEYSYAMEKPRYDVYVEPWQFQLNEPVLWSEYRFEFPAQLEYVISGVGRTFSNLSVNETMEAKRPRGNFSRNRWVMEQVPALRTEPFMTTPRDYRMAIRFQLSAVALSQWGREGYLNSWPVVAEKFMERSGLYGQHLNGPGRDVREAALEAAGDATTPQDKMKRIYDYVRTRIEFNGNMGIAADKSPRQVLRDRTGSSPEIGLLLVAMLREAGLDAHPALLSTRDHGRLNTTYPILSQFNDLIAVVAVGAQYYLLDATDRMRPHDILPFRSLNGEAWMVRHPNPMWLPVEATHRLVQQRVVTMEVDESGRAAGHVSSGSRGYAAVFARHDLATESDHSAYVRSEIFEDLTGLELSNVEITNPDDVSEAVTIEADFEIDGYAQAAGDFIYLSPVLLDRLEENPLKAPERTFPVDMGYGRDVLYMATITIPEGYEVSEVPTNVQVGVEGGGALYRRAIEVDGRTIKVHNRFVIAKTLFEPDQYDALRGFYARIVSADGQQVVLQRAATTSSE